MSTEKKRKAHAKDFMVKPTGAAGYQHLGDRIRGHLDCRFHRS